jgi:hypothetical protein
MFVFLLATEHSWVFTIPAKGNAVRNLGSSPFRRFAFEYAHLWQGCRHVCQLSVIGLAPRETWQIYLARTSVSKLTQQSYTQLTRRVFQIISLLSEHFFCTFRTAFRNPSMCRAKDHGGFKYEWHSTELCAVVCWHDPALVRALHLNRGRAVCLKRLNWTARARTLTSLIKCIHAYTQKIYTCLRTCI